MLIPFFAKKKKLHPFFWVLFGLIVYGAYLVLQPFLTMALLAFVVATLFSGYYKRLRVWFGGRDGWASLVGTMSIMVLFLVPFGLMLNVILRQVVGFSSDVVRLANSGEYSLSRTVGEINTLLAAIPSVPLIEEQEVRESLLQFGKSIGTFALDNAGKIGSSSAEVLMQLFIFSVFLYVFLPSVGSMKEMLFAMSPLDDEVDALYYNRVLALMQSMLKGALVVTLAQSLAAIVFLWIAGVGYLGFWFIVMLATFVVPLGPSLVSFVVGVGLLLTGQVWQGVMVMAASALVVGTIDNFLRPMLVAREAELRPVWVMLGVFGGLSVFGFFGFIFGPVVMVLLKTTVEVYLGRRS